MPETRQHVWPQRLAWFFVICVGLVTAVMLAVLAPSHAPVCHGTVDDFWQAALHLTPSDSLGGPHRAYYVDSQWCVYVDSHLHGWDILSVPTSEVASSLEGTIERLERATLAGEPAAAAQAYAKWRSEPANNQGLESLLRHADAAHRDYWKDDVDMLSYYADEDLQVRATWHRRHYYWATIAFEWLLFTGLALFVSWPVIRQYSIRSLAVHVAITPPLFVLPLYFGYATYTFTSHGPGGGVLYPYVVYFFPHANTWLDRWIMTHTPPLLESISTPMGAFMSLSGGAIPGLTVALLIGAGTGLCLCGARRLWLHFRRRTTTTSTRS
jgi:hypothetical protein